MTTYRISKQYIQKQKNKIWLLLILATLPIVGSLSAFIIGFIAIGVAISKAWAGKAKYFIMFVCYGIFILFSVAYHIVLVFAIIGIAAIIFLFNDLLQELYNLYKYSLILDKQGIWKNGTLTKWTEVKSLQDEANFLIILNKEQEPLTKLHKETESFEALKSLLEKKINGTLDMSIVEKNLSDKTRSLAFYESKFSVFIIKIMTVSALMLIFSIASSILFSPISFTMATCVILFYLYIFWYSPKEVEILEDSLMITYILTQKNIPFSNIKSVDLIQPTSSFESQSAKIRVITKDEKYYIIFNFHQKEYDILNAIKKSMKKEN